MNIVLATTSVYKKKLFERLGFDFIQDSPLIDESEYTPQLEGLDEFAIKLAKLKAESLKEKYPHSIIIGADQILEFNGQQFGKPYTRKKNIEDLNLLSNNSHFLHTAVYIISPKGHQNFCDTTELKMKNLTTKQIEDYVDKEKAFDCAGGYKIESFGISLFESIQTEDFTAIEGLPLIRLNKELLKLL